MTSSIMFKRVVSNIVKKNIYSKMNYIPSYHISQFINNNEWLYHTLENTRVGLTKKAISEYGKIVNIEYEFKKGDIVKKNNTMVTIESAKYTNLVTAPYDLVVLGNNNDLIANLNKINNDPENSDVSWLMKIDKIL